MPLTKVTYAMIENAPANVRNFGAVGDGVTNDTVAIQTALNSGAGIVFMPAGTYRTTSTLYMPSNVTLQGAGKGQTTILCNTPSVASPKAIIKAAAIVFDGSCPSDDYTTYNSSTGDYFTTTPFPFAVSSTFKPGASSFIAANAGDVSSLVENDWLYLGEGIPAWHPAKSEFAQVLSVSGTTVNLKSKLRNGYSNTTTSLGAFIRSYSLTVNPGGGVGGYPNMHTWVDTGFRKVVPVVNSSVIDLTISCNQAGSVPEIAWIMHLAIQCSVDVEIKNGTFWVVDCQDLTLNVTGGTTDPYSSYIGNGSNGVRCNINLTNQVAIEEGAQNISGVIMTKGYSTLKAFASNVDLDFTCVADATPALEVSTVRDVILRAKLTARGPAISINTPALSTIATNLPQTFLSGEVPLYYGSGLQLIGGECISVDNSTLSIETLNGGQVRCVDTVVPAIQSSRYKGTQILNGTRQMPVVATLPLYSDLEAGELFFSQAYGAVTVTGVKSTTVSQQFNFPGTLNALIVDDVTTDGTILPGDIAVFRLSDSAAAPVNWSWAVVQVTKVNVSTKVVEYTPANPAGRTAITALNEDAIRFYRITAQNLLPALITPRASATAQFGGAITGAGTTYGGPLQLGTYHLWVDSSDRLRIKNGVPTSDTDGTVVGTQT